MQRLRDPQWQSSYLAANGTAYVQWEPVFKAYEDLSEAADVLGRPDLAEALQFRVTPQLCRDYAPLLAVLRRVARDPLSRPLVEFAALEERPSDEHVWAEAMQSIWAELQPAEFSMSADSSCEESSESARPSLVSGGSLDAFYADEPPQTDAVRSLGLDLQSAELQPLSPQDLSHSDIIREMSLRLLGLASLHHGSVRGLSDQCCASVWARVDRHARELAKLPQAVQLHVRSEILGWRCSTVLQLLVAAEKLVAAYGRQPTLVDTAGVNMFLNGDPFSPLVVQHGQRFEFAEAVPSELRHPLLLRAGEAAMLAEKIHGTKLPPVSVTFTNPQQYAADIHRVHARNCGLLVTHDLKQRLLTCWRALAGVYLAQDARTILILNELVELTSSQATPGRVPYGPDCLAQAQRFLIDIWPSPPFVFNEQLVPMYEQELDGTLETVLGPQLERAFPHNRLTAAWAKILDAFRRGDQSVEFSMAELAQNVEMRIRTFNTLGPFM